MKMKLVTLSISLLLFNVCLALNYSMKEWNDIVSQCALSPEYIKDEMLKMNYVEKQIFTNDVTVAIMALPLLKWRIINMPKAQLAFDEAMKTNIDELPKMKVVLQTPDGILDNVILIGDLHSNTNNSMSESIVLIRQSDIGTLRIPRLNKVLKKRGEKYNYSKYEPIPYRGQML